MNAQSNCMQINSHERLIEITDGQMHFAEENINNQPLQETLEMNKCTDFPQIPLSITGARCSFMMSVTV